MAAIDSARSGSRRLASGVGGQMGGFKKFILRGNVVDLAVGIVIGAAFSGLVQALVRDLITPLIGMFGGVPDFSSWAITVNGTQFLIGDFINHLLSFLLLALVVYFFVVLPVSKLMDKYRPEPQPSPTKECPECLSKIPELARRCAHCTAQIEAPSEAVAAAMRNIAAPSGEHVADEAARVLVERLQGQPSRRDARPVASEEAQPIESSPQLRPGVRIESPTRADDLAARASDRRVEQQR